MKIEISKNIEKTITQGDLRTAELVSEGDYLLVPKHQNKILGHRDGELVILRLEDVLFAESFKNEVVIHTRDAEAKSDLTLQEIQQLSTDLIRINKSMLVNKTKIIRIRPALNMKYQVYVKEGWLDVNRTYYYLFEEEMGL